MNKAGNVQQALFELQSHQINALSDASRQVNVSGRSDGGNLAAFLMMLKRRPDSTGDVRMVVQKS